MFIIENRGQEIASTDYWTTKQASEGLFFVSGNAGAWRLLVPDAQRAALFEFATARFVEIELGRSAGLPTITLWFEDGSDSPYRLVLDQSQLDRAIVPTKKRSPLLIYTRDGIAQRTSIWSVARSRMG